MSGPGRSDGETTVYRVAVGLANLALAGALVYGAYRFGRLIIPRYGLQFVYVPVIMTGLSAWMAVRGVLALKGGPGGA